MAKIVDKIQEFTGSPDLREQFSFLQKMAESKTDQFKSDLQSMLRGGTEDVEIVGNRAMSYHSGQHVDIKAGASDSIKKAIQHFFKGKDGVIDGFESIVEASLDTLLGNQSIGAQEEQMFFIYPENFAIVRVDVKFYKYSFSNKNIIAKTENIFCYTLSKSIVDHTKLTIDELLYLVTDMIGADHIKEVKEFIQELKEVWKMLEQVETSKVVQNYLSAQDD